MDCYYCMRVSIFDSALFHDKNSRESARRVERRSCVIEHIIWAYWYELCHSFRATSHIPLSYRSQLLGRHYTLHIMKDQTLRNVCIGVILIAIIKVSEGFITC